MRSHLPASLLCFGFLASLAVSAPAQTVTTISNQGPSANRLDLVILGDGYTAGQLGQYALNVQSTLQSFFAQEPFREYQRYFNVHRIDVVSAESGADHPELGVFRNTALSATYNCAGIQRLICVDNTTVNTIVDGLLAPDQHELILVLVNDPQYGGSGGAVAVASLDSSVVELVLHELGHSFGLLADEYGGPPPPSCDNSVEPFAANATRQTVRASIKWGAWISPATPVPTFSTDPGVPGLYEGAQYCDTGLYRPTYASKMRFLGSPFEQINSEQLILQMYNPVSPLDGSSPAGATLEVGAGQRPAFSAATLLPWTHALDVTWKVDGLTQGSGTSFTLDSSILTLGSHTLQALVHDPTPMVRNDPGQLLSDTRSWSLTVRALQAGEFLDVPTTSPYYNSIKTIALQGITAGCGGGNYCPDQSVTRDQMAVFLIRALGESAPAPASQRFADVPPASPYYPFIDRIAALGITAGCGGGNYCPSASVTREQMAVFLVRALGESTPAPASQRFADVPPTSIYYPFIDRIAALGITAGCGGGNYCPANPVTRAQMAVFLVRAFGL